MYCDHRDLHVLTHSFPTRRSSDLLDLYVERQGANRAGEAIFVCGEGADVGHDAFSFRLNKVRAHRVLVVIRPAGDGLAAPLAVETQWRAGRRKEFAARGSRAAAGKLFLPDGCKTGRASGRERGGQYV